MRVGGGGEGKRVEGRGEQKWEGEGIRFGTEGKTKEEEDDNKGGEWIREEERAREGKRGGRAD